MDSVLQWIGNFASRIWTEVSSFSLTGILWMGLAALTICLIVLMRTRWGHARPIWKCAVLSIAAHLLLGGFAYGTKLVLTIPNAETANPPAVNVSVLESATPDSEPSSNDQLLSQPWEQLPADNQPQAKLESAHRIQSSLAPDVTRPTQSASNLAPARTIPADVQPDLQAATPPNNSHHSNAHEIGKGQVPAHALAIEPSKRSDENAFIAPEVGPVERVAREQVGDRKFEDILDSARNKTSAKVDDLLDDLAKPAVASQLKKPDTAAREDARDLTQRISSALKTETPQADPFKFAGHTQRPGDGEIMPDLYSLRSANRRSEIALQLGGSRRTEQAVDAALLWLSRNQEENGRWNAAKFGAGKEQLVLGHDRKGAGARADTAVTALSLLAFMASGNNHLEGDYRETVQHGLEYLLSIQRQDGSLAGNSQLFAQMYCHAMASLALSEALAVTGDQRLMPAVQRAVDFSISAQNPYDGGWRYQPGDQGDMSQFGWQVMALKSAEIGGAKVPERTKLLMKSFLDRCATGPANGLSAYRPDQGPSTTMTAEALLCRYFLYESVRKETSEEAARAIMSHPPGSSEFNLYYWYYATLAMYHVGGDDWEAWNKSLTDEIVARQNTSGDLAGSWNPTGVWCGYGGRVYSTAMATLCLEVYYRYSRVARR